ncbi:MAG: hypothetical protein C0594_05990 [Marinilabiliales bacterium]|nr:MAG: hypothetical protein C0594_05990 [Marinilabiliales bacterium]
MKHYKIIVAVLLSICSFNIYGQELNNLALSLETQTKVDSLLNVFKQAKHDTLRVQAYIDIGYICEDDFPDTAIYYYTKATEMVDIAIGNIPNRKSGTINSNIIEYKLVDLKAESLLNRGRVHIDLGNFDKALESCFESLIIYEELVASGTEAKEKIGKIGVSNCYRRIGIIHMEKGNYHKAIEYYHKSLKIEEESDHKEGIAACYLNIGYIYYYQESYDKALEYFLKSLKIEEELDHKEGIAACYLNIGNVMVNMENYAKALEYYHKSLEINKKLKDRKEMSYCYNNIGYVHRNLGNYDDALTYYNKSLKIKKLLGDKYGIANVYNNLATISITLSDSVTFIENQKNIYLNRAVEYGLEQYKLAKEIEALHLIKAASYVLKEAYAKLGTSALDMKRPVLAAETYKNALNYANIFIEINDSLFSKVKTDALTEMDVKYQTEKKELQINNLEKEKRIIKYQAENQEVENQRQKTVISSFIIGLIIILTFSILLFRLFLQKKKANKILAMQKQRIEQKNYILQEQKNEIQTQNEEISAQKDQLAEINEVLEKKNTHITDSIKYAKLIQEAILPSIETLNQYLNDYFILFKPRNIVSGDFYWFAEVDNRIYLAAVDCTGHGVPGAFMSMIGNTLLNEIVKSRKIKSPAAILKELHNGVLESLKQGATTEDQRDDGMDISLCCINRQKEELIVAIANHYAFLVQNNQLIRINGDVFSVGQIELKDIETKFTDHKFSTAEPSQLYMFSDGYADQFGGPKGQKFMMKRFSDLIEKNCNLPMSEQHNQLEKAYDDWVNEGVKYQQIDDIIVLGLKI